MKDPVAFLDSIKNMKYQYKKHDIKQKEFSRYLKRIRIVNKSEKQKKILANINELFNEINNVIKFVDDYCSLVLETKRMAGGEEPATKPEVATEPIKVRTKSKISLIKLREEFLNKTKNEEKSMQEQIFRHYFFYQTRSYLTKDLYHSDATKNDEHIKNINNGLTELRNSINSKGIPENENPKKVVNIVEKIIDCNKKQKGKGIKILTPKQMLQRLPIALAQVKPVNSSENVFNEIIQIIYSSH